MIEVRGTDFELGDVRLSLKLEQLQHAGSFETGGAFAGAGAHQRLGDAEPPARQQICDKFLAELAESEGR